MDERIKNADAKIEIDGQDVFAFEKINTEWFKDTSRIHYICSINPPRPGVHLFCSTLEYKFYPPGTEKNKDFTFQLIKWKVDDLEMIYAVASIPMKEKAYAEATAKIVGMRIANGVPTLINGGKPNFFPIQCDNAFTIENDTDHIIYKSIMHQKAFTQIEMQLCEMIHNGRGGEVENILNNITEKG